MRKALLQLLLTLCAVAAAAGGYFVLYEAVSAKSAEAAALQTQINAKTEASARVTAAQAALSEIATDETAVQAYFVPESAVVPFIDDLESRGRALHTTVSVTSVAAKQVESRPALVLSLTIDGSFDAVMRTVGAIEYAPYDISVSSLTLALSDGGNWRAGLGVLVGSASSTVPVASSALTSAASAASTTAATTTASVPSMSATTTTHSVLPPKGVVPTPK